MWRALLPSLLTAALIAVAAGAVYGFGGPAWIVYVAIILAALVALPAYERWEHRQRLR